MDASAYFSSGPPTQQQQSGYPPRPNQQQQQYGNNVQHGNGQQVATNNSYGQVCTEKKYDLLDHFCIGYYIAIVCVLRLRWCPTPQRPAGVLEEYISRSLMAYCFIYTRP